jgi:glycosyltransferase involved in cell wall biosynthesis
MTFPVLSETFILREVIELVDRGVDLRIYAMRSVKNAVIHEEVKPLLQRTVKSPFFLSFRLLLANLRILLTRPRDYLAALGLALRATRGMPGERVKALLLFPKSVLFSELALRDGIQHIHALYAGAPCVMAMVMARLSGLPYSFAVRSGHQMYVINGNLPMKIEGAAFVKSVTQFYRRDLLESWRYWGKDLAHFHVRFPEDKVVVVRSAVNTKAYTVRQGEPEGRLVLAVGRLHDQKAFDDLIRAFGVLRDRGVDFQGAIIGGGPLKASLQALIDQLKLGDRVKLLGPKTQREVKDWYLKSRLVAVSSIWEGLPNVLMEALALGVPAVATSVSGIPELIRHEETGLLVRPADPTDLADGIQRLLDDQPLRQRVALAGRKAVEADFDTQVNADRILAQFLKHTPGFGA